MRVVILADGDRPTRAALDAAWLGWDAGIDLVVAVDGGVRLADELGLAVGRWVGDGDSLGPEGLADLRARGLVVDPASTAKDESDAELGLLAAVAAGATRLSLLGGLGGRRPDHALANVMLLGHPAAVGLPFEVLDARSRIRQLDGEPGSGTGRPVRMELPGRIGDLVSLVPLVTVTGVTTTGLRYPLADETLPLGPARGISNVRVAEHATIEIRSGRVLVIEAPATLSA